MLSSAEAEEVRRHIAFCRSLLPTIDLDTQVLLADDLRELIKIAENALSDLGFDP